MRAYELLMVCKNMPFNVFLKPRPRQLKQLIIKYRAFGILIMGQNDREEHILYY